MKLETGKSKIIITTTTTLGTSKLKAKKKKLLEDGKETERRNCDMNARKL